MYKLLLLLTVVTLFAGCQKERDKNPGDPETHPPMTYTDLNDAQLQFGGSKSLDIDANGSVDFHFHTLYVGDALLRRDRKQYYITSGIGVNLLNDANDQSPVLQKGDGVKRIHPGYDWWQISSIVLAEKIIPEGAAEFWQGNWKNVSHKYIPVQLMKDEKPYHGWIEVSFDTFTEKLLLHRAGICALPDVEIKAGY